MGDLTQGKKIKILKQELDRIENRGIIEKTPIDEPANRVNSLVCVDKPDGSLWVCIDPKDLNSAIFLCQSLRKLQQGALGQIFFQQWMLIKHFIRSVWTQRAVSPLGDIAIFECLWELCQPQKYSSDEWSKYLKEFQE